MTWLQKRRWKSCSPKQSLRSEWWEASEAWSWQFGLFRWEVHTRKHRIKKAHPSFSVHWETDQLKKMKSGMHEAESWWRWGWGTELKTTAIRQARVQLSIPILLYLISCSPRFKKVECQLVQYPFSISPFFIALDDVWRNALFKTSLGSEEALLLVKEESVLLNLAIYYFLPELT